MITLSILTIILFIYMTIKMKRNTPKNKNFDPFDHGFLNWMLWAVSGFFILIVFIVLCINYLP
jgi:uncharacterized BrkB/YihY/UPF0761 family membrane protein